MYDRFFRIPFDPQHFVAGEEKVDYSKLAKLKREWRVFRRFFPLIYPYKSKMVAILLLIMVAAPLTEIGVFLTRYIVDDVVLATGIPTNERLELLLIIISFQVFLATFKCFWPICLTLVLVLVIGLQTNSYK